MSILAAAKSALTSTDALVFVIDDILAEKVLIAWTFYPITTFKDSTLRKGETLRAGLSRLWDELGAIDFDELASTAGVPVTKTQRIFKRLKTTLLVWPDGSIIPLAHTIVNRKVYSHGASFKVPEPAVPKPEKKDGKK